MQCKPYLLFMTALGMAFFISSCNNDAGSRDTDASVSAAPPAIPAINYSVTAYLPHDTTLFTEGFLVHNGQIFESTGSPEEFPDAESLVGVINPHSGKADQKIKLDKEKYFGEGIAFLKDKLYQLTYLSQKGFIYDATTFKKTGEFSFASKQGWGLTTDGTHLRDSLNELEYIKGYIYANVWYTDHILKIDPATGKVTGRLDLTSIVADARNKHPRANVLNGIAYDPAADKIYVVGKRWPNIYQIDFPH